MFLGCQRIEYHANHCNINPKEKGIWENLTVVGKTCSCSCRTEIVTQNSEWKKKKNKKEKKKKFSVINSFQKYPSRENKVFNRFYF